MLLWGDPDEQRVVQDADLAHQPRTLRQRGDVRRRRAGRARVRGAVHERAQDRRQDARASCQGLQWKIADMATQLEGARLLLQRAVHMAGPHGTPPALETAMAKTAANLAAKFVCDEAIQLLGGYGFSREYPVERVYRDIRGLCIGAGTVEIQRNFIGTSVLKGATPASDGWKHRRQPRARADVRTPLAAEYRGPAVRGTCRRSTSCSRPRRRPSSPTRRARRGRAARAGVGPGDVGRVAVAEPRRGRRAVPRVLAARRDRGAAAPPGRRRPTSTRCGARVRPEASWSTISTRCPTATPVTERVDRPRAARRRAVHVGIERRAEGRAAHAGDARVQGRADGARARARRRRLRADARALRAHLGPAQRHHAARRRAVPHGVHGRWDPEIALDLIETRAGHVHGRAADVLRRR